MARLWILLVLVSLPTQLPGRPLDYPLPDGLEAWVPWALEGEDRRTCPVAFDADSRVCAWPGRLELDLGEAGGAFAQRWVVFAPGWVPLPGGQGAWPQDVRRGDDPIPVTPREGRPSIRLAPGEHAISGRFVWRELPEGLPVPREIALLDLRLAGERVGSPRLEADGRLWLMADAAQADGEGDGLQLEVQRRVEDDNPLRVVTRLDLQVSGAAREVALGPVLLEGGVPLGLDGPLPLRLDPDGRLRVQVRPGRWVIEVAAYHQGPVAALKRPAGPAAPWPEEEVWVFLGHPELRQVSVTGAPAVDPRQTGLPKAWADLPAYLVGPGGGLLLKQLGRGDEDPAPDRLALRRQLWLDFSGQGFTFVDHVTGDLTRSWRLEVDPPLRLGRVEEDGVGRFITRLGASGREGVEVRPGALDLTAVGRIEEDLRRLPASGWALDLQSAQASLHLPPGWDLLATAGVDDPPDSWVNRWSLLDLFLVLLIAISSWRLWGPFWGILALVAMAVTWQEPGAPRYTWLNLLATVALLRVMPVQPEGTVLARLRGLLGHYFRAGLLILAAVAIPFLVSQARLTIYPQLERPASALFEGAQRGDGRAPPAASPVREEGRGAEKAALGEIPSPASLGGDARERAPGKPVARVDPDAVVQTGPGVPGWRWATFRLGWNGPVPADHDIRLWLLPPPGNLALGFLGILLTLLLGLRVAGLSSAAGGRLPAAAALLLAAGLGGPPGAANAGEFPSSGLLADLRARLLQPPDCLPACAAIPLLELRADEGHLRLRLTVDVQALAAVPMPGGRASWTPAEITLQGQPLDRLLRTGDGSALIPLPAGRWRVGLAGPLPGRGEIEIPLPLRPRLVLVDAPGYRVQGIGGDGRPDDQIRLVRARQDVPGTSAGEPVEIPPLVRLVRTLRLHTDWRVETRVTRLSPAGLPLVMPVPLIPGERVLDEEARVEDGRLLVNLPAGRQQTGWSSALKPVGSLELVASEDPRLSEEWRLDASPQWHLDLGGIPPVHHQGRLEQWLPTWRPWPGEAITLEVARPTGVPGPTVTLLGSDYRVSPGLRSADASLALRLLSSRGGRHPVRLPEGAELESVRVDGAERPLRLEGGAIQIPLAPKVQRVELDWRQPAPIELRYAPQLPEPGIAGVNARLRVEVPPDRWILLAGGPALGPAVLFWGLVLVLALVSIGLGRSRLTPLRTWDWLLLGLGLSQAGIWTGLLVVLWLFALGLRARLDRDLAPWRFNLVQLALVVLTLAALTALVGAVEQGLLGPPEMQIAGNGSTSASLIWFQDRSDSALPQFWVVSVPVLVYRGLMLAWALWLAFRLITWLRWGWQGFASPYPWREVRLRLPGRRRSAAEGPT